MDTQSKKKKVLPLVTILSNIPNIGVSEFSRIASASTNYRIRQIKLS